LKAATAEFYDGGDGNPADYFLSERLTPQSISCTLICDETVQDLVDSFYVVPAR